MRQEDYDRLLALAERSDLSEDERLEFIEQAESFADSPGGVPAALPKLVHAAALLRHKDREAARYVRKAIRLLREF